MRTVAGILPEDGLLAGNGLTPSVEQKLKAYHELSNCARSLVEGAPLKPASTISREF